MVLALLFFLIMVVTIDVITYIGISQLTLSFKPSFRKKIRLTYKILIVGFVLFSILISLIIHFSSVQDYIKYRNFFWLFGLFAVMYFPKILFIAFCLIDWVIFFLIFILKKTILRSNTVWITKINRYKIFSKTGFVVAVFLCFTIIHGIFIGRTYYEITKTKIVSSLVPPAFNGFKVAQISDLHLGSFRDQNDVKKGLDLLMTEKPDMIVFTGDMVNNESVEAELMIPLFKALYAPYGKFSILGNHDMGDYRRWYTIEEKNENINNLIEIQKKMGFIPLLNQNKIIKKDSDSIAIIGVMNWGVPPFKCYGKLKEASDSVNKIAFKILLSHDPSHWDAEVLGKTDIVLTLSGHTHAMQMGINCCNIFWSPVSVKYNRWAGLYSQNNQFLYVNKGFGFIGFPGRIGMYPEISIFELQSK